MFLTDDNFYIVETVKLHTLCKVNNDVYDFGNIIDIFPYYGKYVPINIIIKNYLI